MRAYVEEQIKFETMLQERECYKRERERERDREREIERERVRERESQKQRNLQ